MSGQYQHHHWRHCLLLRSHRSRTQHSHSRWGRRGQLRTQRHQTYSEVKETTDAFVLKADLPGVSESELEIAVHNNILSVSGRRQSEERKEDETYSLYERQFGSFSRSFQLPELADGEKIAAKLEHGVLTLTIGKKAEAKPRKIALAK
jgi:HSP20 family molecular chaperone IbpA